MDLEPVTLQHRYGQLILGADGLTVERHSWRPWVKPQQFSFTQIAAIHEDTHPLGWMALTILPVNAPAIDLRMVWPFDVAQYVIDIVHQRITERGAFKPFDSSASLERFPRQVKFIKVYRGKERVRQFEDEFARLARLGWRVGSQSDGRPARRGIFRLLSLIPHPGSRPRELIVTYVR